MVVLPLHAIPGREGEPTHVVVVDARFDAPVRDNLVMILAEEEVDARLEVEPDQTVLHFHVHPRLLFSVRVPRNILYVDLHEMAVRFGGGGVGLGICRAGDGAIESWGESRSASRFRIGRADVDVCGGALVALALVGHVVCVAGFRVGFGGNPLDANGLWDFWAGCSAFVALHSCHAPWDEEQTRSKKSSVKSSWCSILGKKIRTKKCGVKGDVTKKNILG